MIWVTLIAFLIVITLMTLIGSETLPWVSKLKRVNAGVAQRAEWIAPSYVLMCVRSDYLGAMNWLQASGFHTWDEQSEHAPGHLSGPCLERHLEILKRQHTSPPNRYTGMLHCHHDVQVRHFSEDGTRCLLLDHQSDRRIETFDTKDGKHLTTQALADGTVVYEMAYDRQANRWKINRYIQELPIGWSHDKASHRVKLTNVMPPIHGRDN